MKQVRWITSIKMIPMFGCGKSLSQRILGKVKELIAQKVAHNKDSRKMEKFTRYYLQHAGPSLRRRVMLHLGMLPTDDSQIFGYLKCYAEESLIISHLIYVYRGKAGVKLSTTH